MSPCINPSFLLTDSPVLPPPPAHTLRAARAPANGTRCSTGAFSLMDGLQKTVVLRKTDLSALVCSRVDTGAPDPTGGVPPVCAFAVILSRKYYGCL